MISLACLVLQGGILYWWLQSGDGFGPTPLAEYGIAKGKITKLIPYFNSAMRSIDKTVYFRGGSVYGIEGVEVLIKYPDESGKYQTLYEYWYLPTCDRFREGDSIPVVWDKRGLVAKPYSVVKRYGHLRASLRIAKKETDSENDELVSKFASMLDEYALLAKQSDEYVHKFHRRDDWDASRVRVNYGRDSKERYEEDAKRRHEIVRRELGIVPRHETRPAAFNNGDRI